MEIMYGREVGFLPRFLGAWLIVACFAWLVLSISELLLPGSSSAISTPLQFVTLGEMAIALWLLIKGAKVAPVRTATSVDNSGMRAPQL